MKQSPENTGYIFKSLAYDEIAKKYKYHEIPSPFKPKVLKDSLDDELDWFKKVKFETPFDPRQTIESLPEEERDFPLTSTLNEYGEWLNLLNPHYKVWDEQDMHFIV